MIGVGSPASSIAYSGLFWYAVCFFVIFFPFLVCDLYYAYRDTSCVYIRSTSFGFLPFGIRFSLRVWLQVDGYLILAFILIFLIIGALAWGIPGVQCFYGVWEWTHIFFIIWRTTWLIVGSVIFWKNINPTGACQRNVKHYMFAVLIIGYVWLCVEIFLAFGYPRAIPLPVPVIPSLGTSSTFVPHGLWVPPRSIAY